VGGLSHRFWYAKSWLWQAFSRLCAVIATFGYAHRVPTLGEDRVGKHSPSKAEPSRSHPSSVQSSACDVSTARHSMNSPTSIRISTAGWAAGKPSDEPLRKGETQSLTVFHCSCSWLDSRPMPKVIKRNVRISPTRLFGGNGHPQVPVSSRCDYNSYLRLKLTCACSFRSGLRSVSLRGRFVDRPFSLRIPCYLLESRFRFCRILQIRARSVLAMLRGREGRLLFSAGGRMLRAGISPQITNITNALWCRLAAAKFGHFVENRPNSVQSCRLDQATLDHSSRRV